jgi:hypothetical protein
MSMMEWLSLVSNIAAYPDIGMHVGEALVAEVWQWAAAKVTVIKEWTAQDTSTAYSTVPAPKNVNMLVLLTNQTGLRVSCQRPSEAVLVCC